MDMKVLGSGDSQWVQAVYSTKLGTRVCCINFHKYFFEF